MKKIIFTLIISCVCISIANAQSETQSFAADGIKVIFKPTTKNVVNVMVFFRGGVTNYPANKAGIEMLALEATEQCGTKKYPATAFRDTSDKYGVLMYGASGRDYGFIQMNCISKYFEKGWDLFSDAIMNPVFEASEVNLLKGKALAANRNRLSNPDNHLFELEMQNAFKNTPYAVDPGGNEQTIRDLSATDLADYYKTLLSKNRIFIVVVGNVSKQDIFEKILLAFGNIPSKPYTEVEMKTPVFNDNKLLAEKRNTKLNYIGAIVNSPQFTDVNYVPFRLGISALGGSLYAALSTQSNLVYTSSASALQLKMPIAMMAASSTHVQETMLVMMRKLKEIQANGADGEWLQHIKNSYLTQSYINSQSAASIAVGLGQAEVLGNWQYADDLTKLVDMATAEQISSALNFYITGLRWTYLGNTDVFEDFKPPVY
ncbi:putative Zn-dependent peptidase [Mucilaginibacter frigoritolerans]|uniref:Putative Zn-dependent peptidase n=1 Tax=Mucilaginibacter frigoritolerans TaxID=652788 RepID=A0A562UF66_9SPHI|nr:pitrilysin family protein [Mucilaginibacter frigoritolerans]TWJ04353.1 putative Zn-dependent peptidase [Mucilaginibacter frigoritolerans]